MLASAGSFIQINAEGVGQRRVHKQTLYLVSRCGRCQGYTAYDFQATKSIAVSYSDCANSFIFFACKFGSALLKGCPVCNLATCSHCSTMQSTPTLWRWLSVTTLATVSHLDFTLGYAVAGLFAYNRLCMTSNVRHAAAPVGHAQHDGVALSAMPIASLTLFVLKRDLQVHAQFRRA